MTRAKIRTARVTGVVLALAVASTLSGCEQGAVSEQDAQSEAPEQMDLAVPADTRDDRTTQHIRALENVHRLDWRAFVESHFSSDLRGSMTPSAMSDLREKLVAGTSGVGSALLEIEGEARILNLGGSEGSLSIRFMVEESPPFGVSDISVSGRLASEVLPEITTDNLVSVLDLAEEEGFDGVIFVRRGGETLARRAMGFADADRDVPISLNTVFGTGSQPIEFTIALALIADNEGLLDLEDRVSEYIGEMPSGKRGLTIRHLIQGRSGLPDFLDNDSDWDSDLAWLSRAGLVQRAKAAQLRFEPGTQAGHSHAAYSLLAAIIEIAAEKPYFEYLKEQILDPAGMEATGMYGTSRGLDLDRFAVGAGPRSLGLPNIPPNWGRASWLVRGSGGMYSTLDDLMQFKSFMIDGDGVPSAARDYFSAPSVASDGYDRGFEHFEARNGPQNIVVVLTNSEAGDPVYQALTMRLEKFVAEEAQ